MHNFKNYMTATRIPAHYPGQGQKEGVEHCLKGLLTECTSAIHVLEKITNQRSNLMKSEFRTDLITKISNMCWYVAQLFHDLKINNPIIHKDFNQLDSLTMNRAKNGYIFDLKDNVLKAKIHTLHLSGLIKDILINHFIDTKLKNKGDSNAAKQAILHVFEAILLFPLILYCEFSDILLFKIGELFNTKHPLYSKDFRDTYKPVKQHV